MKDNNITTIFQFGDIFDRRKYINFNSLKLSRQYFFDKLIEYDITMVVWPGNHDTHLKTSLEGNAPSLLLKEYKDNITIIEKPTTVKLGKAAALIIPWICMENNDSCVEAITNSTAELCFGHFEMNGFEMYKNSICTGGISKDLFWKFVHVYSGHFHHISTKDNITYIGAPYQMTWADFDDDRGFFVLDTGELTTEFVKNPYENFHKIIYDDTKLTIAKLEKINYDKYSDTFVKVIIEKRKDSYLLDKFIDKLESVNATVRTVEDTTYKTIKCADDAVKDVDNIDKIFENIASRYKDEVDPKKLEQRLMQLYSEANNLL